MESSRQRVFAQRPISGVEHEREPRQRVGERICSGPKDGPYRATMKFSEVQRMLLDGFGDTITPRDVKKALDIAFPGFLYRSL